MLTRREFFRESAAVALGLSGCTWRYWEATPSLVNDIHSQLNPTRVARVVRAESLEGLQELVRSAGAEGNGLSIAGGRHAMGGQQFGTDTILVDMTGMRRVLRPGGARSRSRPGSSGPS